MFFYSGLFSKAYIPENQNVFPFTSTMTLSKVFSISEAETYFHWNFLFYSETLENNQVQKDKNLPLKSKWYWHLVFFFSVVCNKKTKFKIQDSRYTIEFYLVSYPKQTTIGGAKLILKFASGCLQGPGTFNLHIPRVFIRPCWEEMQV